MKKQPESNQQGILVIATKSPALKGRAKKFGSGYRKFALVRTTDGKAPAMISNRCKTVLEIVACSTVYYGKGKRGEGARYLEYLRTLKAHLEA